MIWSTLSKYQDVGLLVLRIGVGSAYIWLHGWGKISGGPEAWTRYGGAMQHLGIDFAPTFWGFMAAFAEFGGGILLILGLFFRPACALLMITMFVAVGSHLGRGDGWRGATHALKMFFVFIGLATVGPGRYSVDYWLTRRRSIL